jgi:aromatic ring-opening dioxygenase catalytic subunit (LigB family)
MKRMPVIYLPHGGGPWPFMDVSAFGPRDMYDRMRAYLEGLRVVPPERPRAVLVVSAHWEAPVPTVMTSKAPPMLYDYYGFPPDTYTLKWPAPGEPDVAREVQERVAEAGFATAAAAERGFDHGTFVPLMLTWPEAQIPTLQLSLLSSLDPVAHLELGRALEPLRDQGVLILGSGMSYHNMRGFFGQVPSARDDSQTFDDWMVEAIASDASTREARLAEWAMAPRARACHPREEHLLPLMVCAGAAGDDAGTAPYRDVILGAHVSAAHFG